MQTEAIQVQRCLGRKASQPPRNRGLVATHESPEYGNFGLSRRTPEACGFKSRPPAEIIRFASSLSERGVIAAVVSGGHKLVAVVDRDGRLQAVVDRADLLRDIVSGQA